MFDYLIVGSGFFGSICAYELNKTKEIIWQHNTQTEK
jgi:UDP-galactopyranose mutase